MIRVLRLNLLLGLICFCHCDTMRLAWLLIALFAGLASGVNFVYDETLWSKQGWLQSGWKLPNPLHDANPIDENPGLSTAFPHLKHAARNSLDGFAPRRLPGAAG